jgi:cysteine synthase A
MDGIKAGFCGAIGSTPLLEVKSLSKATGCQIVGKAEFMNPGSSVKDRAALGIVLDAEQKGFLRPGGMIFEGSAGNTGIGLAHVAKARGYQCTIVIPETQSPEKFDQLRALGAKVLKVKPAPYKDPQNYNHIARRLAEETPGGFWANQFDNTANRGQHMRTTGPEIYQQTAGKLHGFVSVVGTGGTLAGVATYLKSMDSKIVTACADPHGAGIWSWVTRKTLEFNGGTSITEGIGQNRITKNLEGAPIDLAFRIADRPIIEMVYFLREKEGLCVGTSSALNMIGAYLLAKKLGPGHTIVSILCDSGSKYLSRLFNDSWLDEKQLRPVCRELEFLTGLEEAAQAYPS